MKPILTKFIICSLPRTGTKSLIKMMKELEFGWNHAPGPTWESFLTSRYDIDVMADTPMYSQEVIEYVLERSEETKFIYIDKEPQAWVDSFFKVGLHQAYELNAHLVKVGEASPHNQMDYDALYPIIQNFRLEPDKGVEAFNRHRDMVMRLVPPERLLVYTFDQGWGPLCEFVGKDVPELDVPHLNKDTMFDGFN